METYDLAIGWQWEYDAEFVAALEATVQIKRKLTSFQVTEQNIGETRRDVQSRKLHFSLFLDRAFDVNEEFAALGRLLKRRGGALVNDYEHTEWAIDKATMHLEFLRAGLFVPFTIIVSPFTHVESVELTIEDLAHLGRPFIIKPANTTGGSIGVVTGAETLIDVIEARKELEADKYLLQEKIVPRIINGRRCWFRCFFVYGKVFLNWWDDQTHLYQSVTADEEHYYKLRPLRTIMRTIASVSKLNFFSSEIALRQSTPFESSRFIVIDYVNDMCDMRRIDSAHDGLPNALWTGIVDRLALMAQKISRASG